MFNGIWPEPTNKQFISAYLQIQYLIFRKIHSNTFWLNKTPFLFITSHHDVSEFLSFFKNRKIRVKFSNGDFPAKPAKQKKQVALKKSLRLHTCWGLAAGAERVYQFFDFFFFFQNSWSCPHPYLGADCRQKSPLDGAKDFLATIWQHITIVSFL